MQQAVPTRGCLPPINLPSMLHSSNCSGFTKPRRCWQHAPATRAPACHGRMASPVRAQAVAAEEGPGQPKSGTSEAKQKKLKLSIYQPKCEINWNRWELLMLQLIEAREEAAAARGESSVQEEDEVEEQPAGADDAWEAYFRQYDNPAVHLPRLSDSVYMAAWANAIEKLGPSHIKGKVVLDLGCGPGLLSLMCAKAGAKKVFAVDGSKAMAAAAKQVAEDNGVSSIIEVMHARVEELRLRERADVLVCDWAGHGLLAGGMLQSVAYAKQHLLKPNALLLPSFARVSVTGIEDRAALAARKQSWSDVGGFNLTGVMTQAILTPHVATVQRQSQLCTTTGQCAELELGGISRAAARAGIPPQPFKLTCQRDERLFGVMLHFDLGFGVTAPTEGTGATAAQEAVVFTTHPKGPATSFQQLVLNFPRSIKVNKGDVLEGTISMRPSGLQGRDVAIDLQISYAGVTAGVQYTLVHSVPLDATAADVSNL